MDILKSSKTMRYSYSDPSIPHFCAVKGRDYSVGKDLSKSMADRVVELGGGEMIETKPEKESNFVNSSSNEGFQEKNDSASHQPKKNKNKDSKNKKS